MAVTLDASIAVDEGSVLVRGVSDRTPPVTFTIYRDGEFLAEQSSPDGQFAKIFPAGGGWPLLEITDLPAELPQPASPGRVTLAWQADVDGAYRSWRIEEYVASVWTARATIPGGGKAAHSWKSRLLEDATSHQFRVIGIDAGGAESAPLAFTALLVRHPDAPDVEYSYDAGTGIVTAAAA